MLAGVGLYTGLSGATLAYVGGGLAAFGCALLLAALTVRLQVLVPWAVLFAGSGYVVARLHHHTADGWAAIVGAALLLSAELAAWSIDDDARIHTERAVIMRRGLYSVSLVGASALAGFVLVGATAVALSTGVLLTAVGVAAAVASIGLVLRLVRS